MGNQLNGPGEKGGCRKWCRGLKSYLKTYRKQPADERVMRLFLYKSCWGVGVKGWGWRLCQAPPENFWFLVAIFLSSICCSVLDRLCFYFCCCFCCSLPLSASFSRNATPYCWAGLIVLVAKCISLLIGAGPLLISHATVTGGVYWRERTLPTGCRRRKDCRVQPPSPSPSIGTVCTS